MMLAAAAVIIAAAAGDPWTSFLGQGITLRDLFSFGGMLLLVILFSRDLILTKGQHERRVADIVAGYQREMDARSAHHAEVVASKDAAYGEMKESRNYWREDSRQSKLQTEVAVTQLTQSGEGLTVAAAALHALATAAAEEGGNSVNGSGV